MRVSLLALSLLVLTWLSGGCHPPEYYRDFAVDKARDYALSELPQLSEENRAFIRLADPVFMKNQMFDSPEKNQLCLVWTPPHLDGDSVIVVGLCDAHYDDWNPIRVLIKPLPVEEKAED